MRDVKKLVMDVFDAQLRTTSDGKELVQQLNQTQLTMLFRVVRQVGANVAQQLMLDEELGE